MAFDRMIQMADTDPGSVVQKTGGIGNFSAGTVLTLIYIKYALS